MQKCNKQQNLLIVSNSRSLQSENAMRNAILVFLSLLMPLTVKAQLLIESSQTVNTSTGEMQFTLPLGTVQGINGAGFPVNLSYGAGIKTYQAASPAGLGFSYGPGSISRKVVYVADNNTGGDGKFEQDMSQFYSDDICDKPWWRWPAAIFLGAFFLSLAFMPLVDPITGFGIMFLASVTFSGFGKMASVILFNSSDYIAGGSHQSGYNKDENGQGFFPWCIRRLAGYLFCKYPLCKWRACLGWSGKSCSRRTFYLKGQQYYRNNLYGRQ